MMTLNTLIEKLTELRTAISGDTPVVFSFNGCTESGTFMNVTEVVNEPYFFPTNEEFYLVRDYIPAPGDVIRPLVHISSNGDPFIINSLKG